MTFRRLDSKGKRLRQMCVVICLVLALLPLGCVAATPTPEPVTIRFLYPSGRDSRPDPDSPDSEYYAALAQRFNQSYPNVTVELVPRSWQNWNRTLQDESGLNEADVYLVRPGNTRRLQARGALLNLDPWIEGDKSFDPADFYPGVLEPFVREGKTWGIPSAVDPQMMFFNVDLFDLYGVPYPGSEWTWDDFVGTALALRDPDADVFGYVITGAEENILPFIYQHGGQIFDDWRNPTTTTFDDPLTVDTLEWYANLVHVHDVVPTRSQAARAFGGPSQYNAYNGIRESKVGMWIDVFSDRGGLYWPSEWMMRWGMVPLPHDVHAAALIDVVGYAISATASHPEACWQWIVFLSEQIPFAMAPARRSLAESSAYEERVGDEVAALVRASIEDSLVPSLEWDEFGPALEIFWVAVNEVLEGNVTPEEAMVQAQREAAYLVGQ